MKRLALMLGLSWPAVGVAAVHRVPADYSTIQAAVLASNTGDTVLVSPGTYNERVNFYTPGIHLLSTSGKDSTILRAVEASAVVQFVRWSDSTSVVRGFTIDGANISMGLWLNYASPTIEECEIRNCDSWNDGVAISCLNGSRAKIRRNIIHDATTHMVGSGGVIWVYQANPEISENILYGNTTAMPGMTLWQCSARVERNVLYDNACTWPLTGAAIYIHGGLPVIRSNTLVGNTTGIINRSSAAVLLNNIITSSERGGIVDSGSAQLSYNNVWNNGSHNVSGPGGISADPLFVDSVNHDYRLDSGSPCIDAGDPNPRFDDPDGSRCDIGRWPFESTYAYPRPEFRNLGPDDRLHAVNQIPTFYWTFADTAAGTSQTAYELEVGTDEDWSLAEQWASGLIASVDTFSLYGGSPLQDGVTYFLRLRVSNGSAWGDWTPLKFVMNEVPSVPGALVPRGGTKLPLAHARLTVVNAEDSPYEVLTYQFEVFQDSALTLPVESDTAVREQPQWTHSPVLSSLMEDASYWWHARAFDGFEYSPWTAPEPFNTRPPGGVLSVPVDAPTIQFGINLAVPQDTVLAAPGEYREHINFLGKAILLSSELPHSPAVLKSAIPKEPVVKFVTGEGSLSVLQNITIDGDGQSPGILYSGSGPLIVHCDVTRASKIGSGGGINCVSNSTAHLLENRIYNNSATQLGAAICVENSNVDILGNEIFANTGQRPGVALVSGQSRVLHNLIYNNLGSEPQWGAGLWMQGDGQQAINNTIVGNSIGIAINTGSSLVLNNVVAGSLAEGILDLGNSTVDYNITWRNGSANGPGIHGVYADPGLVDPAHFDFRLTAASPCIDAGHSAKIFNDPDGSRNDVGAQYHDLGSAKPWATNLHLGADPWDHVTDHSPTLGWYFADTAQGAAPSGYEVEVGTDHDWSVPELWATGPRLSPDTSVVYEGAPLRGGAEYLLRIRVYNGSSWGDWRFLRFIVNQKPSRPSLNLPPNNALVPASGVQLRIQNSFDTPLDTLRYDFEIYGDSMLSQLVAADSQVMQGADVTISRAFSGLEVNTRYWWRARAFDSHEYSGWMATSTMVTRSPGGTIHVPSEVASIQEALDLAASGDTILVAPGTYEENIDFQGKAVALLSVAGAGVTTIRSASENVPVVQFTRNEDSASVLRGFGIDGAGMSRGIVCDGADPILEACDLFNAFTEEHGGAIYCRGGSRARIRNNDIHDNYAEYVGAGIFGDGTILQITGNRIYRNTGTRPGIGLTTGPSEVTRNLIFNNFGTETNWAAGIWFQGDGHRLIQNTVVGNTVGLASNSGYSIVRNNIVANNRDEGILIWEQKDSVDYNDTWSNGSHNAPGPHGITLDPQFLNPATHEYALQHGSPCIDAGDPALPADPDGSPADIGALPYVHPPGDVTGDGIVGPADVVYLVNFVLKGGPPPGYLPQADVDGSCTVTLADVIYLTNYVFNQGPPPQPGCAQRIKVPQPAALGAWPGGTAR